MKKILDTIKLHLNIKKITADILNTTPYQKRNINQERCKPYVDITLFSDEDLDDYITQLANIRNNANDNAPKSTSLLECSALHATAMNEKNNRKRNRLGLFTVYVGVTMGLIHISVLFLVNL